MNAFDFTFVVLPLGISVFLLVAGIMLLLNRGELARERKIKRIDAVLKKKDKQHEMSERQLQELGTMYGNKAIDSDTYKRLQTLIKMHEEREEETEAVLMKIWQE
jgi:hypothetical protein